MKASALALLLILISPLTTQGEVKTSYQVLENGYHQTVTQSSNGTLLCETHEVKGTSCLSLY